MNPEKAPLLDELGIDAVVVVHPGPPVAKQLQLEGSIRVEYVAAGTSGLIGRAWSEWVATDVFCECVGKTIEGSAGAAPLLVLLSALDHVELTDLWTAIGAIRRVRSEYVLLALPERAFLTPRAPNALDQGWTMPPVAYLPALTWGRLLAAAGFEVIEFSDTSEHRPEYSNPPNRLRSGELFRLLRISHPPKFSVLLRACGEIPKDKDREVFEDILDINYRRVKTRQLESVTCRIGFNILMFQDFLNIKPIVEALDSARAVVLVRRGFMDQDAYKLVCLALDRLGVARIGFDRARELDWKSIDIQCLITVTEGSLSVNHLLGRQIVEAANLNGIPTFLLQHGIRVQPTEDRILNFASDWHLTWSRANNGSLKGSQSVAGVTIPSDLSPARSRLAIGSPKFSDTLIGPKSAILENRLGVDRNSYRSVVLVGTNLHWGAHRSARSGVVEWLGNLIDKNNDLFFLVKVHPSERHGQYRELFRANSLVLDDPLMLSMDISVSRLINGVDLVVSSLSTLLLDGAVAGKPVLQYNTRNKYSYRFCEVHEFSAISSIIEHRCRGEFVENKEFLAYYADAEDGNFYSRLAEILSSAGPPKKVYERSAVDYSICSVAESLWLKGRGRAS